jgi:nicotinamidase-related amidase
MSKVSTSFANAAHVAVDAQNMFLGATRWRVADMSSILPNIAALAGAHAERTIFTRFVPPRRASDAPGAWRDYYEVWSEFTAERMPPGMVDIVPALAEAAACSTVIDKHAYSAFEAKAFAAALQGLRADTLILTGVETDACVLATLLAAVDQGFRVVAVVDALASGSPPAHAAVIGTLLPRLKPQVEAATTADVLAVWRAA